MRVSKGTTNESLKTAFSGGFTDFMKAVDKMLETYYRGGQVEILVTDNGIATVTVFPRKGGLETVTVQLDYPHDKMTLLDDRGNKKVISIDVDKTDFDRLGKSIISLIDDQIKSETAIPRTYARRLFSLKEGENEGVIVKVGNKWRILKKNRKSYWDAEYDTKSDAKAALRAYWASKNG